MSVAFAMWVMGWMVAMGAVFKEPLPDNSKEDDFGFFFWIITAITMLLMWPLYIGNKLSDIHNAVDK